MTKKDYMKGIAKEIRSILGKDISVRVYKDTSIEIITYLNPSKNEFAEYAMNKICEMHPRITKDKDCCWSYNHKNQHFEIYCA